MHEAGRMCIVQSVCDLGGEGKRVVDRKGLLFLEAAAEGLTCHERHDVIRRALDRAGIEKWKNVRMRETCHDPDFARKAFGGYRLRDFEAEELEGDRAVVLDVMGEVYNRHSPRSDRAFEAIRRLQSGADALEMGNF
jgi:hypothetical protein